MEAWIGNGQGLYILFYIFRVVNMASNEETQYFLKEEIYMIGVATVKNNIRLRKEEYDGITVVGPSGINTPFWTALTEVLEVEPWAELIVIKGGSVTYDYDWEQLEILTDKS